MSLKPSDFKSRAYGFTYAELSSYDYYKGGTHNGKSPIHGDYGLYKSGNLHGISDTDQNGYKWWAEGSPTIFDRTYAKTSGKQYGHFLYVDASNESRQIASADFKANLCTGSQLIFSGAVAEYTAAMNSTAPQVMFRLYGIDKDENGNVTDQKLSSRSRQATLRLIQRHTHTVSGIRFTVSRCFRSLLLPTTTPTSALCLTICVRIHGVPTTVLTTFASTPRPQSWTFCRTSRSVLMRQVMRQLPRILH